MNLSQISILCSLLFIVGCTVKNTKKTEKMPLPNWYNVAIPAEFVDDDSSNWSMNEDNLAFIPKRKFIYNYTLSQTNEKKLHSIVKFNRKCIENNSIDCIDWEISPIANFDTDSLYPIEKIALTVFESKGHTSLSNTQTIIKYDYLNSKGRILFGDKTGVVEDSNSVFLHPPRNFGFCLTEFCPFPEIRKGKESWTSTLHIPSYWFEDAKLDYKESIGLDVEYTYKGKKEVETPLGTLLCHRIDAKGTSEEVETSLNFWYHEEYGFVKLDYQLPNSYHLVLNLEKIEG
ncbi:hypothetical protein [Aureispira sp. CCB-QB1]|uniref:hypothetical protein n=1 Tax=Aureispira sp. CCB-QB1 TaxID=1313421 RepID=UPI000697D2AA|nr:hypothetical protein [Aureispira sp. CCB-QB1]